MVRQRPVCKSGGAEDVSVRQPGCYDHSTPETFALGIFPKKLRASGVLVLALAAAGCGGDDPSPITPTPLPLSLACPAPINALSPTTVGVSVSYASPVSAGGTLPVAVTCSPISGQLFVPGPTTVACTATDALTARATCSFQVTVTVPPRLSRTRFLAFGDSITAGEVTVPVANATAWGATPLFKQIVVPAASYPTVLEGLLRQRYLAQTPLVVNAGRPGETAGDGVQRFRTAMAANSPDAVLLLDGHNDLGFTSTAILGYNALAQMAREAKASGARVFLATLVPSIPGRLRSQPADTLLLFNDAVRALAASEGAVLVDLHQAMLPNVLTLIGVDGLHPNEAGYARMAELFGLAIRAEFEVR